MQGKTIAGITVGITSIILLLVAFMIWKCRSKKEKDHVSPLDNINKNFETFEMHSRSRNDSTTSVNSIAFEANEDYYVEPPKTNFFLSRYYKLLDYLRKE